MPTVDTLVTCLKECGVLANDGDDEDDNVPNTSKDFLRVDEPSALEAVRRHLQNELLLTRTPFR